jgi:hypothetical protein
MTDQTIRPTLDGKPCSVAIPTRGHKPAVICRPDGARITMAVADARAIMARDGRFTRLYAEHHPYRPRP